MSDYGYQEPMVFQQPETEVVPSRVSAPMTALAPVPIPPSKTIATTSDDVNASQTNDNIFADTSTGKDLDVTSIITMRLNAMRKLQENPLDSEAIKLMYNTQKDVIEHRILIFGNVFFHKN